MNEFLVTRQHQATAFDLPFYNIFASTKNYSFKVCDDVIAVICGLAPPLNQKSWLRLCYAVFKHFNLALLEEPSKTVECRSKPQREIFPGGTKVDAGTPNLFQKWPKKGLHWNLVPFFAQN